MASILLTGFGPYGHTPENPAQSVVQLLNGEKLNGATVAGKIIDNTFFKSVAETAAFIEELQPSHVVMLGEYPGRSMITVERVATNFNDATRYGLVDNDGFAPMDEPTDPDGPAAYFSTLPIRAMARAMRDGGIPADISDTAGTLVCNHLFYGVLHHVTMNRPETKAGWIHLPALPAVAALEENLNMPSMSAETAAQGVRLALDAAVKNEHDLAVAIPGRLQI